MTLEVITKKDRKKLIHGLYLVTDRNLCLHHSLLTVITKSILGGVKFVQLREKSATTKEFIEIALETKAIIGNTGVPLIINDRIDVALAVDADGVHLGQNDMPVNLARKILGKDAIIGLSIESLDQLEKIPEEAHVDYLGVSPIFSTPTKTDTKGNWGIEGLKHIRQLTTIPLVAIGGINDQNAQEIIQTGAESIAVVSYLCSADDPEENARKLIRIIS